MDCRAPDRYAAAPLILFFHNLTCVKGLAVNLLLLLFMTHICFPRARPHTRKFFALSCYNPLSSKYTLGQDDLCMVTFWIVALTGLRAAVMDYVLAPIAQASGIKKQKERVRFAEQAWIFIYGTVIFSLGLVRLLQLRDVVLNCG